MNRRTIIVIACAFASGGAAALAGSGAINWKLHVQARANQPAFAVSDAAAGIMLEVGANGGAFGVAMTETMTVQPGVPLFRVGDLLDNHGEGAAAFAVHDAIHIEGDTHAHGDITIATADFGIVLTAPDGSRWRLLVDNDGTLITAEVE